MAAIAPELSVLARDEAFEALYRRYVKDVYHYALALLRNPADAEDVTQTTFMNAYRAYCRGDHIERPQNWLIKITHNVARSRYARSSRRVKEVPLEDHVDQLAVPEDERPNVEGVLRALGRLPFNQRAALIMRELEGRSYGEIAETLNVSVAAVETLIFRARRSLRLRASALRSLGAVPLPASLAQLVEGGGVVAGGGALLGSGFIFKAALALVAGALATGLGGGQQTKRVVAARPHVASNAVRGALPQTRVGRATVVDARHVPTTRAAGAQVLSPSARHADPVATGGSRQVTAPLAGSSSAAAPAGPASPASATEPVDQVVATVETTISVPSSSLPVQVPSVPDLPVQPPALPKLP